MTLRRLWLPLACCLLPLCLLGARRAVVERDAAALPEDSRWLSFVRLSESRWEVRVRVPPAELSDRERLLSQCVDDAWYLAMPSMLSGTASPCGALVSGLGSGKIWSKAAARARSRYSAAFSESLTAPSLESYLSCVDEARTRGDVRLLEICGLALRPRSAMLVGLTDQDRFQGWFTGCKRAILGDQPVAAGEQVVAAKTDDPVREAHARHCLRALPTFYEIRWMRKLSDYWTPEEQKLLYQRSQQLGREP